MYNPLLALDLAECHDDIENASSRMETEMEGKDGWGMPQPWIE